MASDKVVVEIERFLESYRSAYQRFDLDAIARHFVFPGFFVSDADEVALIPVATEGDCRGGVERVLNWHRELGVVSSRTLAFEVAELSPRLASLSLHAAFHNGAGERLYDYSGVYSMVRKDGAWRVATICHNQIPRLLACLADHRATQR